jgi:uncharacterized coiled-coil protein SlyX
MAMEDIKEINLSIPVTVFGKLTPYNDVISKARVRIFYKGLNRNNTYISDEFAEKLLSTISYSPICGIYDDDDFTDHGENRSVGKAYGVVPENPNITWEKHMDNDGVEREYACADVLLWTARYKEASEIPGKAHSMELYDKSIAGTWKYSNGRRYFEFTDGCFIGLTPLGDGVEPCFEGSAFYTLATSLTEMVEELKNYTKSLENKLEGGQGKMTINFKLSDSEKHMAIWSLLNTNFTEEGNYEIQYDVLDIYDDYALVFDYDSRSYYRVKYTKDNEKNEVTLGDREKTYVMDVSESELNSLKAIKALNGDTYEKIDETFSNKISEVETLTGTIAEHEGTIGELNTKVGEHETTIGELNAKVETLTGEKATLEADKTALEAAKGELETYKANKEKAEKQAVLSQYSERLEEEVISEFTAKIDEYTIEDLSKELALKLVESNPSIFSKSGTPLIPQNYSDKEDAALSPAAKLLKKHRNRNKNGGEE